MTGLLLTILESAKGYWSVKISEYNKNLREDQEAPLGQDTRVIGFGHYIPEEENTEEEEYE